MFHKIDRVCLALSGKIKAWAKEEKGAVDIVAIVVLIGIAVLLATTFKTQISSLLNDLFSNIGTSAKDAIG